MIVRFLLTVVLKKDSRATLSAVSTKRLTLSQHAVERLQKSNVPTTDDSYKYSYQRMADGYGTIVRYAA